MSLVIMPPVKVYLSDVGSAADSLLRDTMDPAWTFGRKCDAMPNGALVLTPYPKE